MDIIFFYCYSPLSLIYESSSFHGSDMTSIGQQKLCLMTANDLLNLAVHLSDGAQQIIVNSVGLVEHLNVLFGSNFIVYSIV